MCAFGSAGVFWASMRAWRFVPKTILQFWMRMDLFELIPEPDMRTTSLRVDVVSIAEQKKKQPATDLATAAVFRFMKCPT